MAQLQVLLLFIVSLFLFLRTITEGAPSLPMMSMPRTPAAGAEPANMDFFDSMGMKVPPGWKVKLHKHQRIAPSRQRPEPVHSTYEEQASAIADALHV